MRLFLAAPLFTEAERAFDLVPARALESLSELSPTIEQLAHTIRYAERP
jgi:hypothetical protein